MRGEGVIDERVHVVKTHFPERHGLAPFLAHRAILLVRNPWDVIDSYFNMTLTNSHNTSMHDSQYERFAELFRSLAIAEVKVWCMFNRWWLRSPIPLIVVRYEDLLTHRERTLRRICWFLNKQHPIKGSRCEKAIASACALDLDQLGPYVPRRGGGRTIGAALRRFSPALRSEVEAFANVMLHEFGYTTEKGFPNHIHLAPRAIRHPVPNGDDCHVTAHTTPGSPNGVGVMVNSGEEIRKSDSPYGRYMTTLRKSLLQPIISDDGFELNIHEVEIARDKAAAANAARSAQAALGQPSVDPRSALNVADFRVAARVMSGQQTPTKLDVHNLINNGQVGSYIKASL